MMTDPQEYRNKASIIYDIFAYLSKEDFTLTGLREKLGLHHYAIKEYLELIKFIQAQPQLMSQKVGKMEILSLNKENFPLRSPILPISNTSSPPVKRQVHISNPKRVPAIKKNDSLKIISRINSEITNKMKLIKWKVSKATIATVSEILYTYWIDLEEEDKESLEFPNESFDKIIGKLTMAPEELQEEEKNFIEEIIQSCWEIFSS